MSSLHTNCGQKTIKWFMLLLIKNCNGRELVFKPHGRLGSGVVHYFYVLLVGTVMQNTVWVNTFSIPNKTVTRRAATNLTRVKFINSSLCDKIIYKNSNALITNLLFEQRCIDTDNTVFRNWFRIRWELLSYSSRA